MLGAATFHTGFGSYSLSLCGIFRNSSATWTKTWNKFLYSVGDKGPDEMHYMEMQHGNFEAESNYASLQPQYEETGKKMTEYENVDRVARM